MSLIQILRGALCLTLWMGMTGLALFSSTTWAGDNCRASSATLSFGNITAGQRAQSSTTLTATCQDRSGVTRYFRLCLKPQSATLTLSPMSGPSRGLQYQLYDVSQPGEVLSDNHAAQLTFSVDDGASVSQTFRLLGRVPDGQNSLAAGDYRSTDMLSISWASAENEEQLPECGVQTPSSMVVFVSSATMKNACVINEATPLNFGSLRAGNTAQLEAESQSAITVQCPVNTKFSIGLDNGQHASSSQRQLCDASSGECVAYKLFQDHGYTTPWGNSRGVNTLNVESSSATTSRYTVYGQVPAQPWPASGNYTDTVVVTLWY